MKTQIVAWTIVLSIVNVFLFAPENTFHNPVLLYSAAAFAVYWLAALTWACMNIGNMP